MKTTLMNLKTIFEAPYIDGILVSYISIHKPVFFHQIPRKLCTSDKQINSEKTMNNTRPITQNASKIHGTIQNNKINLHSLNRKITEYARKGMMVEAHKVFVEMSSKDVVSWNSLMSGYIYNGMVKDARQLFDKIPSPDSISWNSIISGYVKNADVNKAKELFDKMPSKNLVSWNWMLVGYLQNGRLEEGLNLLNEMPSKDVVSWNTVMRAYAQLGNMLEALKIFDTMVKKNTISWNIMISGYVKAGDLMAARNLFDIMPNPDVFSWTTMITGYTQNELVDEARLLFDKMPEKNNVSWNAMLAGYAHNGKLNEAVSLFEAMPMKNIASWNTLISVYMHNGRLEEAKKVFDSMICRDSFSWSTMIAGYVQNEFNEEALKLFYEMLQLGFKVIQSIFPSVLHACGNLAAFRQGKLIHSYIIKKGFEANSSVGNALITMYCKCGSIEEGYFMFKNMTHRDGISWNGIIAGHAQHGCGLDALELFKEMQKMNIKPDAITFISVLAACSHAGLVDEGKNLFLAMGEKYGITASIEHYNCMVDLLGRAGYLKEAEEFIHKMPVKPETKTWKALLSASRIHGDKEMAKKAAEEIFKLEPENSGSYVLLSNTHAAEGEWDDVRDLRCRMKESDVKKEPGCSWVEVNNEVHVFQVNKRWRDL